MKIQVLKIVIFVKKKKTTTLMSPKNYWINWRRETFREMKVSIELGLIALVEIVSVATDGTAPVWKGRFGWPS